MEDVLKKFDEEIKTITERRGAVYGHPADDFAIAASLMSHFDHVQPPALRHALRLICVKMARLAASPTHLDSYVDVVGYARTAVMVMQRGDSENRQGTPPIKHETIERDSSFGIPGRINYATPLVVGVDPRFKT